MRDLIRTGEVESTKAQDWVEDLVRTSRLRSEAFASTVRTEVRRQLSDLGFGDVNDIARRVASILDKAGTAARRAGRGGTRRTTSRPGKKTAAKKAGARRTTTAKKTAAKKAGARRTTTAKKTAAKKAGARRTTTAKKTAAKKAGGRRTTTAKKKASGSTSAARRRS